MLEIVEGEAIGSRGCAQAYGVFNECAVCARCWSAWVSAGGITAGVDTLPMPLGVTKA